LVPTVRRCLRDANAEDYSTLWVVTLLSLLSHAASALDRKSDPVPLLTVRVELWMHELRRMMAYLPAAPKIVHPDDLRATHWSRR
jgi:DEAD/DEAH box helicase domain-containing protein